jgi:DtxR family Mn-dependent transcriptional regulator
MQPEEFHMPSSTVEDYVKRLYLEQQAHPRGLVPMGRLAEVMGVVPGTATAMIKTLADSGLVRYRPRAGVTLSPHGEKLALHILRRHRLVELFLVRILGLDWSEVHTEAEELEHVISDRVLDRIDALLSHPEVDPHGDPIPSPRGKLARRRLINLATCPTGVPVRIERVVDQEAAFLRFIEKSGLAPGTIVVVESRDPAADAVQVRTKRKAAVSLGARTAAKIQVLSA